MPLKFNQYWMVEFDKNKEYEKFTIRKYIPGTKDDYSKEIKKNTVKFNQTWDVISKHKERYERFVTETFYPCLEDLGIKVAREWEVLIGDGPRIVCEGRAENIGTIPLISNLQSKQFQKAKKDLKQFVENYESRILTFHIQKILGYKSASCELISG